MQAYIILGAFIGLPMLVGIMFRVSASHLLVSLLAGELLERYFTDDAQLVLRPFIRSESVLQYVGLVIMILPVLLTALFLRHTLSKGKTLIQVIPYLLMGVILAAFGLHLLPEGLQSYVQSTELGKTLFESTDVIIGGMIFLQLIALWLTARKTESHGKHH